jgi:hypothetical protein
MFSRSELFNHVFKRTLFSLVCLGICIGIVATISRGPHTNVGVFGLVPLAIFPILPCVLLFFEAVNLFQKDRRLSMANFILALIIILATTIWVMSG